VTDPIFNVSLNSLIAMSPLKVLKILSDKDPLSPSSEDAVKGKFKLSDDKVVNEDIYGMSVLKLSAFFIFVKSSLALRFKLSAM